MAVQIAFVFQSPDRTDYLNQRLAGLIGKGIYSGAELTPTGSGLTATRGPFFALGLDGITIWDNEVGTFTYTSGIDNYHVLLARYNPLGTPSTPVVQELVLSASEYNTHVDKPYLIVIGKVTPAGGVLVNSEIDYATRDEVGPFGRAQLRGVVDTTAELPTGDPNWNRSGDLYVCNDEPAPGGGGLYMWEDGTGWRLVAAKGAATLDGAYDNNGAGGPPGYGRTINVDSGAVELLQDTASQRQNDVGNAALRIRKTGSTVAGDVGTDIVVAQDKDVGGLLIRSHFASGTYIQADEPVNVSGNTITGTRGAANWNHSSIHKIPLLVELTDSAYSNDGLFIAMPNGSNTCVIRSMDASTPTLSAETGTTLKANFYSIRYSMGAANVARLTEYETGSDFVASTEFYGTQAGTGTGKIIYYNAGTLSYVWKYRLTQAGASAQTVAYMTEGASWVFRPPSAIDNHGIDVEVSHATWGALKAVNTSSGPAARFSSTSGIGVYVSSAGTNAFEGHGDANGIYVRSYSSSWGYAAVRAVATAGATAVYATSGTSSCAVLGVNTASGGIALWGELQNAGDTTGYGVYAKHAGNGKALYAEALGSGGGQAVRGNVSGTDAVGVYGEHELGSYAGWGVIGWNNNTDTSKAAVDGFAWGNGPGVQGGSVFGKGVYGNSTILSLEPGVHGHGFGFGAGVKGTSDGGIGVVGSNFSYDGELAVSYKCPLSEFTPQEESYWNYGTAGGGATVQPAWCLTSGSGTRDLWWQWNDFPDGIRITGVSLRTSQGGTTNYDLVLFRRQITWTWNAGAQAYLYSTESFTYLINHSWTIIGSGTTNAAFGPASTPAVVAHSLDQPSRMDPTDHSDIVGSELCVYFGADAVMNLLAVTITCELFSATKFYGPTTL